jgi:hypothetical protein
MRRLVLISMLGVFFAFPSLASAQTEAALASVSVQLWPEYDQPSMLVIVDFQVAPDTPLPVDLSFRIPPDGHLIAVASAAADGRWVNAAFEDPLKEGEWQVFTMPIQQNTLYRYEYYQPLTVSENQRTFSYLWDGAYAVEAFSVSVLEPLDTVSLVMEPPYLSIEQAGPLKYYDSAVVALAGGEQYVLNLQYEKTTDTLVKPPLQGLQPVTPLDDDTPGRFSLNNYLPYLIGGLGVILIVGGIVYYWQAGGASNRRTRRRGRAQDEADAEGAESYCPQCGARAKPGDRFCRVCGARLRNQEE